MAIFTAQLQTIRRAQGRSVVAAAAYRSGDRLHDERLEMDFDFGAKGGIVHTEILAPDNAPTAFKDREALWNAAEAADKRKDSVPAQELLLALPHELDATGRRELVLEFVAESLVKRGMIADIAIHEPGKEGDQRNHHAHVMMTTRTVDQDGFGKKDLSWNHKQFVVDLRREWAEVQNRHLERRLGKDAPRVTEKSFAERGIEHQAGVHLGPEQTAMTRRGEYPERSAVNQGRADTNARTREIDVALDRATASAPRAMRDTLAMAVDMEALRDGMVKQRDAWRGQRDAAKAPKVLSVKAIENAITRPAIVARKRAARRLEVAEDKAKAAGVKVSHIQQWARDPVAMAVRTLWRYNRKLDAVLAAQKQSREADKAVADARAWLKSPEGKMRIAALRSPGLEAATAVRLERSKLDRNIRRIDARIRRASGAAIELRTTHELGTTQLVAPAKIATDSRREANEARYIQTMRAPAAARIVQFPKPLVMEIAAKVIAGKAPTQPEQALGRDIEISR